MKQDLTRIGIQALPVVRVFITDLWKIQVYWQLHISRSHVVIYSISSFYNMEHNQVREETTMRNPKYHIIPNIR